MKRLLLTFTTILLWSFASMGGIIDWTNTIETPQGGPLVQIGQPEAIDSLAAHIPLGTYNDAKVVNRISLGVNLHYPTYFSATADVSVRIKVKRWDVAMAPLSDTMIWLNVLYSPSDTLRMIALSKTEFSNAYKMVFSIEEIKVNGANETILPANLFVQGDIFIERYLELGSSPLSTSFHKEDKDCDGKDDAVTISWSHVAGAEEYHLEWAYINDYSDSLIGELPENALNYDFKYNSTRITTSANYYTLSLVFDKGWLIYRVRAIGVNISNPSQFIFGPWDVAEKGTISGIAPTNKMQITDPHERGLNWQYTVSYAEQGKHKEIVNYFDGTLRSRQTVTRVNSDNNIVVGETIYDFQGRPAITVLPVPVTDSMCNDDPVSGHSIHLYRDFNQADGGLAYSASHFDISDTGALCAAYAQPMITSSGASKYYSHDNPKQAREQAYVPDAEGYPFVHVEYTPDNTGRIRRQGGVGPEFQIGPGHETRYLYGQPNQLELDRLFGSEVGNYTHYDKNVVIDAHGQASLSYLDQQGRVIATALAGDNPDNLLGIPSENTEAVELEVNALTTKSNTIGMDNRSLVFSSELLVAYQSEYEFTYDFDITPVDIECLDTVCVDCVYDLSIELIDECGMNHAPFALQNRIIGKFESTPQGYTFHAQCTNPLNGDFDTTFTADLSPGTYSLHKKLTVNQAAIDSLVALYLKSDCAMTLEDFTNIALSNIDTSSCDVNCADCFERLGTVEDFVTQGYGNSNDYYLRVEECKLLCSGEASHCKIMESILQVDMSPGGQYGEYIDLNTDEVNLAGFPLSVYNTSNVLPNASASWKNPVLNTPQGQSNIYVNQNGERSKIYLSQNPQNPGIWLPAPADVNQIQFEQQTGMYYIYPEQLANTEDFIDLFEQSWAKSLLVYHPEYCYYETCLIFEQPIEEGDVFTSVSFDKLLQQTTTVEEAFYNGFITAGTSSNFALTDWFVPYGGNHTDDSVAWDPFVYYSSDFNSSECTGNYGTQLQNRFNNYKYIDGAWRSMAEVAALTARCGTTYATSYPLACYNFGYLDMSFSIDIINEEWNILKALYLSEKQKLQRELADCRAIKECGAYNGCIGKDDDYNPFPDMAPYVSGSGMEYPFLDHEQPCSFWNYPLYASKIRRFADETDIPQQDANAVAYEIYLQTGQCPAEFTFQSLFSAQVQNDELTAPSIVLNEYPQFAAVAQSLNNFNIPGTLPLIEQQSTVSGNVITTTWLNMSTSSVFSTTTLTLGGTANWTQVTDIVNLHISSSGTFTADAIVFDQGNPLDPDDDTTYLEVISGTSTLTLPTECEFSQECSSNELAKKLTQLMNTLLVDSYILDATPVDLNPYVSSTYGTISGLTNLYIENAAGVGSNLHWVSIAGNLFKIYDPAGNPNDGLYISLNGGASVTPGILPTISHFGNLTSIGNSSFELQVFFNTGLSSTIYGSLYREIGGERIGIKSGDCGLPTPSACQTPAHDNYEALQALLNDVLVLQNYDGTSSIDLFTSVEITPSIISSLPLGTNSTSSQLSVNGDTLTITAGTCGITLMVAAPNEISDLIGLRDFIVTGSANNYNNFYDFQFTGVFNNGIDTTEVTVYGTSCIAIKECNPCVTNPEFITGTQGQGQGFDLMSDNMLTSFGLEDQMEQLPEEEVLVYDSNMAEIKDYDSLRGYLYETYLLRSAPCPGAYTSYMNCVNRYNDSVVARGPGSGLFLIEEIVWLPIFQSSEYCDCADHFCGKISQLLAGTLTPPSQTALHEILNFNNFCGLTPVEPEDPCEDQYEQYLDCIAYYNSSIDSAGFPVTSIRTREQFTGMCNCVNEYCSRLNAVLNGLVDMNSQYQFEQYMNMELCNPAPGCAGEQTTGIPSVMPEVTINNNCVEMQINQAHFAAQVLYQNYVDSLSNALIEKYVSHCLSNVNETFKYSYWDKLHHFTLYYYDQAGNLIKTVPPEGVELLSTTSSFSTLSQQIEADRTNNTKTVFTNHRLATRYEYNSLNQLVYQTTPDTDPMDIFEITLPNGLHQNLITHKIQMINENVGYLGGEVNGLGMMYRTNDGGVTWSRVQNLVGADIKKAIMYNGTSGIAIGEKGTLLTTDNNGASWNLVAQAWMIPGVEFINDLNDIAYISISGGYRRFIIVGENRTVIQFETTSSGPVITELEGGLTSEPTSASVTAVTTDGTNFFITVYNDVANISNTYRLPNGTSTWVAENNFASGPLKDIDIYDLSGAYAVGEDGRIYKKTNVISTSERWKMVKSDLINTIHAVRFFNEQNGVALVELQTGKNYLMRTFNGGANWVQISEYVFNHLSISINRSHVLAVGENGIIEVVPSGITVETIPIISGTTEHLTAGWIDNDIQNGLSRSCLIVTTATGAVRYTSNGFVNYPQWISNNLAGIIGTDNVTDIRAERGWTSGETIYGAVLTEAGNLYRLEKTALSHTVGLTAITGATDEHEGFAVMGGKIFSVDKTTDDLVSISMSASIADYTVIGALNTDISSMIAIYDHIVGVGTTGGILNASLIGTHTSILTQLDESLKTNPNKLKDITYGSGFALCSGEDGTIYRRLTSPSIRWERFNTHLNETINALAVVPGPGIIAVGENGLIVGGGLSGINYMWQSALTTSGATVNSVLNGADLLDVYADGTTLYAVGENGKVVYSPNAASQSFLVSTTAGQRTLYGVSQKGFSSVLIAGEGAYIETRTGTSVTVNELLVPPVIDLHFMNASTGTYLTDHFVIRTTSTGGNDWNVIYPNTANAPTNDYFKVWTKSASESYIFGNNTQYRTVASGLASPVTISGYTVNNVRAIAPGTNANELYMVNDANVLKLNFSTHVATNLVGLGAQANALHVFRNGSYLAVGASGLYKHYSAANTILESNPSELVGVNINDLKFTDNISGTLVGDNGAYFTTTNPSIDAYGYLIGVDWNPKIVTGSSDPLGATLVDIHTIAFASPANAVFGGTYTSGTFSKPYVRKVFDASSRYSARFFYDRLGRQVVTQNSRQYNGTDRKFSYKLYDALGRVYEAGEKTENSGSDPRFSTVFGTSVSNYFNPSVIDDVQLAAWINASGARKEVTKSYYDHNHISGLPVEFDTDYSTQNKRIVHMTHEEIYDGNDQTFDHATHYRYDIHGNVRTLVHDNKKMAEDFPSVASQRFKRIDYAYDLLSGNIHRLSVQNEQSDQWHHAFVYDANNRISQVYTSTTTPFVSISGLAQDMENELYNNNDWQSDARYFYYDHGPLARVEIGQNNLQGMDYYYTLQGWVKGINSSVLDSIYDPGKDSDQAQANALFAKDVFGFGLSYFTGDYNAISSATPQADVNGSSHAAINSNDLYNGNVRYMQTSITNPNTREKMPMLNAYKYDQLNRISESRSYETGLSANSWNPTTYNNEYFNAFTYDANGNILTQERHKRDATKIEDLSYKYQRTASGQLIRNRLYHVKDQIDSLIDNTDINDMGTFYSSIDSINQYNNYVYDAEGRLVKDRQEEIDTIIWRVDGKVKSIMRTLSSEKKNLTFDYNSFGQRIAKHVFDNQTGMLETSTYYILDAQGQQLSMYEHQVDTAEVKYYLTERNIYGSSRLGMTRDTVNMYNPQLLPSYGVTGNRNYELKNHLSNVLTVITDQIMPLDQNNDDETDGYQVAILNTFDYSPFGVHLDGRTVQKTPDHCAPVTTMEIESDSVTYENMMYGVTPMAFVNADGDLEGYSYMHGGASSVETVQSDEWITFSVSDVPLENETFVGLSYNDYGNGFATIKYAWYVHPNGTAFISESGVQISGTNPAYYPGSVFKISREGGNIIYSIDGVAYRTVADANPSSTMVADITTYPRTGTIVKNLKIHRYVEVVSYPCGENIAGNGRYRYGFNGMEKDDEIKGPGNSVNYTFRMHDSRLGRFFAIDPLTGTYPMLTPYQFSSNSPIYLVEIEGLEGGMPAEYAVIPAVSTAKIYWYYGGREQGMTAKPKIGYFLDKPNGGEMWVVRYLTAYERELFAGYIAERREVTEKTVAADGYLLETGSQRIPSKQNNNTYAYNQVVDPKNDKKLIVAAFFVEPDKLFGPNVLSSGIKGSTGASGEEEFTLPVTSGGGQIELDISSKSQDFAIQILDKHGNILATMTSKDRAINVTVSYGPDIKNLKVRIVSTSTNADFEGSTMAVGPWNSVTPFSAKTEKSESGNTSVSTDPITIRDNPSSSASKPLNSR